MKKVEITAADFGLLEYENIQWRPKFPDFHQMSQDIINHLEVSARQEIQYETDQEIFRQLGESFTNPTLARQIFQITPMPQGALPIYSGNLNPSINEQNYRNEYLGEWYDSEND